MFRRLSTQVLALLLVSFLALATVSGIALLRMSRLGAAIEELAQVDSPLANSLTQVTVHQLEQDVLLERMLRTSSEGQAASPGDSMAAVAARRFEDLLQQHESLEREMLEEIEVGIQILRDAQDHATSERSQQGHVELLASLTQLRDDHEEKEAKSLELITRLRTEGGLDATTLARLETDQQDIEQQLTQLLDKVQALSLDEVRAAERTERRAVLTIATVAGFGILLLVLLGLMISGSVSRTLRDCSSAAQEVSRQMLAAVQQQSASSSETASSVSETTSTLDEFRQTVQVAAEKAGSMADTAEHSLAASNEALASTSRGIEAMQQIRQEVEGIARNILDLSERTIEIGEIAQSVNGIAEQSNLLAVNASIEAAKAGEHGKGFAVVASEVRTLAGQSKEATAQIRSILTEIQKASNAAVMVTEQGSKRVEEGARLIEELGQAIQVLSETIEESYDSGRHIALTTNQQLAGVEQIATAMRNIEQATRDNAAGAQQLEGAAHQVEKVSNQLRLIASGR